MTQDQKLAEWLTKRLERSLPMDQWQVAELQTLRNALLKKEKKTQKKACFSPETML